MKLYAKAWVIDSSKFREPWYVPEDVIYSDKRTTAKVDALSILKWSDLVLTSTDEEPTYLNVPLKRAKNADKYMLEDGRVMGKYEIEYEDKKRQRNKDIDKLVAENPQGYAYIKKGGSYWMPNGNGYTEFRIKAGVYSVKEAAGIVKSSSLDRYETMILINKDEHNQYILGYIEDLKTRLI